MVLRAIDWSAIFEDLRRSGMDDGAIVRALNGNISHSAIRMYRDGINQPTHMRGELILALWCQNTGRSRDTAPMCDAHDRLRDDRHTSQRSKSQDFSAFNALDAVFRPGLTQVIERINAKHPKHRQPGDSLTLPLPGFEK